MEKLHHRFLGECRRRLEELIVLFDGSLVGKCLQDAIKVMCAVGMPLAGDACCPQRSTQLQSLERLMLVVERYIMAVEQQASITKRSYPPHMVTYFATPFEMRINCTKENREFNLRVHTNERLGSLRERVAALIDCEPEKVALEWNDNTELKIESDGLALKQLGISQDCNSLSAHAKTFFFSNLLAAEKYVFNLFLI